MLDHSHRGRAPLTHSQREHVGRYGEELVFRYVQDQQQQQQQQLRGDMSVRGGAAGAKAVSDADAAWVDLLTCTEVVWVNEEQETGLPYDIVLRWGAVCVCVFVMRVSVWVGVWVNEEQETGLPYDIVLRWGAVCICVCVLVPSYDLVMRVSVWVGVWVKSKRQLRKASLGVVHVPNIFRQVHVLMCGP